MSLIYDTKPPIQFLALPKTGCTWMCSILKDVFCLSPRMMAGDLHCVAQASREIHADRVSFTIIRDPWQWALSAYSHCSRGNDWIGLPGPAGTATAKRCSTWAEYLDYIIKKPNAIEWIYHAYTDQADIVLTSESLAEQSASMFTMFGWNGTLCDRVRRAPPQNASKRRENYEPPEAFIEAHRGAFQLFSKAKDDVRDLESFNTSKETCDGATHSSDDGDEQSIDGGSDQHDP